MLISIEYNRPIPHEFFSANSTASVDMEKYFKKGWCEGKTLGAGKQENVLPRGFKRFFKNTKMPAVVYQDGTGIVVLGKELGRVLPNGSIAAYVLEVKRNLGEESLEEIVPEAIHGTYKVIGIPSMTPTLPFIWGGFMGRGEEPMLYGALMHRPGPSPEHEIPLRTARAMLDAIG